jgi:hypothetical protein
VTAANFAVVAYTSQYFHVSYLLVFLCLRFEVFKEVNIVLWNVTSCSLVDYHEDGGSRFFLNAGAVYRTSSRALIMVPNVNDIEFTRVETKLKI